MPDETGVTATISSEPDCYGHRVRAGHRARRQIDGEVVLTESSLTSPGWGNFRFHIAEPGLVQVLQCVRSRVGAVAHHRWLGHVLGVTGEQIRDRITVMHVGWGDDHSINQFRVRIDAKVRLVPIETAVPRFVTMTGLGIHR